MERKSVIAEDAEGLVVMAVHVPDQEVQDGHVYDVRKSTTPFINGRLLDHGITVTFVRLPGRFSPLVI